VSSEPHSRDDLTPSDLAFTLFVANGELVTIDKNSPQAPKNIKRRSQEKSLQQK